MLKRFCVVALAAAMAGCTSANEGARHTQLGTTVALTTTGSTRLITERTSPHGLPIVCTEPSPDYATAFDKKATATIKLTDAAGGVTDINPELSSVEHMSEGKGRAEAVLALRDGLYAACQSYANGVIGQDAYSMILSQYGALLVALVGRQTVTADGNSVSARGTAIGTRQATLSALVVACVSSFDESRAPKFGNALLTPAFCHDILRHAVIAG